MCRKGYHLQDQGMQLVQRLSAAVPGPKAPKAGRSPAGDRQTEGAQPGVLQSTPAKCRTSAVPLFTQNGKVVTLKGG